MAKQIISDVGKAPVRQWDLMYGPTYSTGVFNVDGDNERCWKIEGQGYLTSSGADHYIYMQLNGKSTGNYLTTYRRLWYASGVFADGPTNAPTWGIILARLSDWSVNGFWSFSAVVGPVKRRGGAFTIPYRSQSVFSAYTPSNVLQTDFVGLFNDGTSNPITTAQIGVALASNGAQSGSFDEARIVMTPFP